LNGIVDEFWAEISGAIDKIELLYEDDSYSEQKLAALVASKVYYHLGEYDDALSFALGAGELFDVAQKTQFVNTIISKCIDQYVVLSGKEEELDPRLADIVERMFRNTYDEGEYKQAVGIALEARSLGRVEEAITLSGDVAGMLNYVYYVLSSILVARKFRLQVLRLLARLYAEAGDDAGGVDYLAICQCLLLLDDAKAVSDILLKLMKGSSDDALMAYQVAFDLSDNETQHFLSQVNAALPEPAATNASSAAVKAEPTDGEMEVDTNATKDPLDSAFEEEQKALSDRLKKMSMILSGETTVHLTLEFLFRNNKSDMLLLKQLKDAVEPRNSITHNACVMSNALMHAGTTVDTFLRENIEWLKRSTNWAKFAATGCVGVIHKGHIAKGLAVLKDYLPGQGSSGGSPYLEGGALYALGIINANHGESVRQYLVEQLNSASGPNTEVVQHGACLGLGLASMASGDDAIFEQLKAVMYGVNAVSGEAAGYGMGLVMLGTAMSQNPDKLEELVNFAQECDHEKITRGVCMGMSLIMYGREEEADTLIEQLSRDKESNIRYGAMYTIGMAYAGTANNPAIRQLLHVAVSDVSDDVRRAAVLNLGFVMSNVPERVPRVVALLATSYNPHVRYGAVMAVGFSCAGTGLKAAVELLQPMTKDAVDFVRQGAFIALAMVLIQVSDTQDPAVTELRTTLEKVISDKHEDTMTKFGCFIAEGIINAGGRNVTIALHAPSGHKRMASIVGMAIFSQYWYWYPLIPMLSLTFAPTMVVGLNKDLNMPVTSFKSNAKPELFAYPPMKEEKKKDTGPAAPTAVLSITEKAKKRDLQRTKSKGGEEEEAKEEKMDVEEGEPSTEWAAALEEADLKKYCEGPADDKYAEMARAFVKEREEKNKPKFHEILNNPARVTIPQREFIVFDQDDRYRPVRTGPIKGSGVILLSDSKPDEEQVIVETSVPGIEGDAPEEDEPEPPAPFEYAEYM